MARSKKPATGARRAPRKKASKGAQAKPAPHSKRREAAKSAAGTRASRRPAAKRPRTRPVRPATVAAPVSEPAVPAAVPGLNEEDQIRAAKFLPRELPKRLFEEERFLFPETYGVNRIRLLVRDPDWIFAYWDVNPAAMSDLGRSIGERALALSRLTLRIVDPTSGARSDILLPYGSRWWYVRTDSSRRTYRADLGVTLPSGEFRRLAESNTVVTPRVGPSAQRAERRLSYGQARGLPLAASSAAAAADRESGLVTTPWPAGGLAGAPEPAPTEATGKGGASDAFAHASRAERPGASDGFRR